MYEVQGFFYPICFWGERTAAFLCDRDNRRGDDARSVLDKIADIIRAECVIRGNYPNILIRAHDAAVMRMSECDLLRDA
jgi:hypothetical protein